MFLTQFIIVSNLHNTPFHTVLVKMEKWVDKSSNRLEMTEGIAVVDEAQLSEIEKLSSSGNLEAVEGKMNELKMALTSATAVVLRVAASLLVALPDVRGSAFSLLMLFDQMLSMGATLKVFREGSHNACRRNLRSSSKDF